MSCSGVESEPKIHSIDSIVLALGGTFGLSWKMVSRFCWRNWLKGWTSLEKVLGSMDFWSFLSYFIVPFGWLANLSRWPRTNERCPSTSIPAGWSLRYGRSSVFTVFRCFGYRVTSEILQSCLFFSSEALSSSASSDDPCKILACFWVRGLCNDYIFIF